MKKNKRNGALSVNRASGVLMHVSSLWGDYSEGSFGKEAKEWIDFLSDCGFSYWQTLPFCLPDSHASPYSSLSAFSVNPNFIDLPSLFREGLITEEELKQAAQKTPWACEFDRLNEERLVLLAKAAARFDRWEEAETFFCARPQIGNFCRFMGLRKANHDRLWTEWTESEPDEQTMRVWEFICFTFFRQWADIRAYAAEKDVKIIGDIPIYVSYDSSDVWANPKQFLLDEENIPTCVAGVPPDYFSADGQLWGNPLYDWEAMKADGFGWWKERMRVMAELFDGVRIDHFRGLESYYSIPAGETTAKNGRWVKGPGMDLIEAIREICPDKLIIAEDLGDITPQVRDLVEQSGFPGMRVLQFGFLGDRESPHLPHNYTHNCVAYTGTHDNNTLLGYVWELDENTRKELLDYCGYAGTDWDRGYDAILRTVFASHAGLLILPVQDLLLYGSDTRLNKPGVCDGNWSYRLTKDQLNAVDRDKFRTWNRLYGRK